MDRFFILKAILGQFLEDYENFQTMTFGENQRGWFLEAVHDEESLSKVAKEQNPKNLEKEGK